MKRSVALLATTVVFAIGGVAANASTALHIAHAPTVPGNNSISGTWLASYDNGVHIGYIQFQKGGTLQDMMDFGPKTGNALVGDWSTDGRGTYTVLVEGFTYDNKGNTRTGYFTKTESETLSGDSYSGTFEVTYYDLNGNITFQHDGSVAATRIEDQ